MCVAIECVFVLLHLLLRVTDCVCARASAHIQVCFGYSSIEIFTQWLAYGRLINSRRTKAHSQAKYINLSLSPLATFETHETTYSHTYDYVIHVTSSYGSLSKSLHTMQSWCVNIVRLMCSKFISRNCLQWNELNDICQFLTKCANFLHFINNKTCVRCHINCLLSNSHRCVQYNNSLR